MRRGLLALCALLLLWSLVQMGGCVLPELKQEQPPDAGLTSTASAAGGGAGGASAGGAGGSGGAGGAGGQ